MHTQTHILSGWCIGNLFGLTARERLFCMVAAGVLDVDGLGILVSQELYWDLHHKLGHCLLFGVVIAAGLTAFSVHRVKGCLIYLGLFHLHLLMDFYGSGPGWGLYYYWPFSGHEWRTEYVWPLFSWQNLLAAGVMLAWALWIAWTKQRTPLEALMPSLDRKFIAWLKRRRASEASGASL